MNSFEELENIPTWRNQAALTAERNQLVKNIKRAIFFHAKSINMTFDYPLSDDELDELANYGIDICCTHINSKGTTYKISL